MGGLPQRKEEFQIPFSQDFAHARAANDPAHNYFIPAPQPRWLAERQEWEARLKKDPTLDPKACFCVRCGAGIKPGMTMCICTGESEPEPEEEMDPPNPQDMQYEPAAELYERGQPPARQGRAFSLEMRGMLAGLFIASGMNAGGQRQSFGIATGPASQANGASAAMAGGPGGASGGPSGGAAGGPS